MLFVKSEPAADARPVVPQPARPTANRANMLNWLTNRNPSATTARELYGSSVAQARQPAFYRNWCVADTFSGRFDLVMLHVGLLVRRLSGDGRQGADLARALSERMFASLDDDLREIGIGDLSVPKKVRGAASSFYGHLRAYDLALAEPDDAALVAALGRNCEASEGQLLRAEPLAAYVRSAAAGLAAQPLARLSEGRATFPRPEEFVR